MCSPALALGIASFGLGAAQSIMRFRQDKKDAEKQQQYYEENKVASRHAAISRYASIQNRIMQEREAASAQKVDVSIDAAKARSKAIVGAAEGGVEGNSVDALVRDYYTQEGRYNQAVDINTAASRDYLRGEMDATYHQAIARVQGVPQGSPPSIGSAILGIGSAALNGFSVYNQFKIA